MLDDAQPAAWVVDLLERIDRDPRLRLHIHVASVADSGHRDASNGTRRSPGERFARFIIYRLVDSPRFESNARIQRALPSGLATRAARIPERVDVIVDVGEISTWSRHALRRLPKRLPTHWPATRAEYWTANVATLQARVECALLDRAPFFWLHLWRRSDTNGDESALSPWQRLASHAMPRQSFSVTDLTNAALLALPAVIVSRLCWLAEGRDPLGMEQSSLPNGSDTQRVSERDQGDEVISRREQNAVDSDATLVLTDQRAGRRSIDFLVSSLLLLARKTQVRIANRVGVEQWQLATTRLPQGAGAAVAHLAALPLADWKPLAPPADRLWADPHLCRGEDGTYVFFEELFHGERHGHIVAARLADDGSLMEQPRRVLEEPFHLSYPFVFQHDERHYLMPETASHRGVSLYTTDGFPGGWRHYRTLLTDVNLADSTLFHHDGRWWLFTNSYSHRRVNERDELRLYHADSLDGEWQAHPLNPVVTGVDRARMAGPIVVDGNAIYRPNQYGAVRYGHGINIARIDVLSPSDYRETPIHRVLPVGGSPWLGCHSLATDGRLCAIDRVRWRPRWPFR